MNMIHRDLKGKEKSPFLTGVNFLTKDLCYDENTDEKIRNEGESMAKSFAEIKNTHLPTLTQYVPVVDRVHGDNHPEFHEVRAIFENMVEKINAAGDDKPDLDQEFARLREVTGNYTIPGDVCETYAAVYQMLAELDRAYQAQ